VHFLGTKCPLLMALFFFLSSSAPFTFLPEGVIIGLGILHMVLRRTKNKGWVEKKKKWGNRLAPRRVDFFGVFFSIKTPQKELRIS
jgi:hypothetical protein